ncbi:MAG: hypothetical protein N838_33015 [Thiohalocapsa sp. PB-PSB1]|nr:MAG: hypothetical protein N838_33015 [Thiohalocapsa sp. PB-PSB1]
MALNSRGFVAIRAYGHILLLAAHHHWKHQGHILGTIILVFEQNSTVRQKSPN